jgi:hypothetical protein
MWLRTTLIVWASAYQVQFADLNVEVEQCTIDPREPQVYDRCKNPRTNTEGARPQRQIAKTPNKEHIVKNYQGLLSHGQKIYEESLWK